MVWFSLPAVMILYTGSNNLAKLIPNFADHFLQTLWVFISELLQLGSRITGCVNICAICSYYCYAIISYIQALIGEKRIYSFFIVPKTQALLFFFNSYVKRPFSFFLVKFNMVLLRFVLFSQIFWLHFDFEKCLVNSLCFTVILN